MLNELSSLSTILELCLFVMENILYVEMNLARHNAKNQIPFSLHLRKNLTFLNNENFFRTQENR